MKNLLYLLILLSITSCMTVGRIEKNCDKFASVCVTETVTKIVYRDTTIYRTDTVLVPLPADTVKLIDTVQIINNKAYLAPVHEEFGLIGVDASVKWSVLNISAYLTDSTILTPLIDTIFLEKAIPQQTTTNTVVVKERFIPKFYKFTFWWFILQIIIVGGFIGIKLLLPLKK